MTAAEALRRVIEPLIDQVPFFVRAEAEAGIPALVAAIIADLPKYGWYIERQFPASLRPKK